MEYGSFRVSFLVGKFKGQLVNNSTQPYRKHISLVFDKSHSPPCNRSGSDLIAVYACQRISMHLKLRCNEHYWH